MNPDLEEKRTLGEKLKETYRLIVIDDNNLREVGSKKFSLIQLYLIVSASILFLILLVVSLVVFTPVKTLIPGYEGDVNKGRLNELVQKVSDLEVELENQSVYTQGLLKMINGEEVEHPMFRNPEINDGTESDFTPEIIKHEELVESERAKLLGQLFFVPPVTGTISAAFDKTSDHLGVDILAPKNTPVKSIMEGRVISSDWTLETGKTVCIQHSNSIISFYKHNSALLKKTGDFVKSGEAIAIIGNTGTLSDGPHLHFELWYDGIPVNPENFIKFN